MYELLFPSDLKSGYIGTILKSAGLKSARPFHISVLVKVETYSGSVSVYLKLIFLTLSLDMDVSVFE